MPALPRLAAPPPRAAPSVRRRSLTLPPPSPLPRHPHCSSSWNSRRRSPPRLSATAAGAPREGPLPEPEGLDQLLQAALSAARIRDEESRRSDPLFIDPYAAILLSYDVAHHDIVPWQDHYRLTTRYIDDKLQNLINNSEDIRQIVLLTDGMDTRPYRLNWPRLSVIYDVSPGKVFTAATQQLRETGAKVSRNSVLLHTSLESHDLQVGLSKNGFNGNKLSLWVLQGSDQDNLEKLFFTHGFRVSFVQYDNVAKDIGFDLATPLEQCGRMLFVAEQMRFSDAQMESFRIHFGRIEEDADEEGFEEL